MARFSLTELKARFLRYEERSDGVHYVTVDWLVEAQGLYLLCPKCFEKLGGPVGTHSIICWSETAGTPSYASPGPGRWRMVGYDLSDLSLMEEPGRSRSIALTGSGCGWHGYVTNGYAHD